MQLGPPCLAPSPHPHQFQENYSSLSEIAWALLKFLGEEERTRETFQLSGSEIFWFLVLALLIFCKCMLVWDVSYNFLFSGE